MNEVVVDGEVGRIVDFEDPANPLARALHELSADPRRWSAMGARARERVSRYSTRAMSESIQDIYNELLYGKQKD